MSLVIDSPATNLIYAIVHKNSINLSGNTDLLGSSHYEGNVRYARMVVESFPATALPNDGSDSITGYENSVCL